MKGKGEGYVHWHHCKMFIVKLEIANIYLVSIGTITYLVQAVIKNNIIHISCGSMWMEVAKCNGQNCFRSEVSSPN